MEKSNYKIVCNSCGHIVQLSERAWACIYCNKELYIYETSIKKIDTDEKIFGICWRDNILVDEDEEPLMFDSIVHAELYSQVYGLKKEYFKVVEL